MVQQEVQNLATTQNISELEKQLEHLTEKQIEITHSIDLINAKLQATADYTDDIISTANNVLTHADTVLTFYLGGMSVVLLGFGFILTWWTNKTRDQHIKEAGKQFLESFANNEKLQDEFIKKLVAHPNIGNNINTAIDKISKDAKKMKDSMQDIIDNIDE